MNTQTIDFIEEEFGNLGDEMNCNAEYLGHTKTEMILLMLVKELKELNRTLYNRFEVKNG